MTPEKAIVRCSGLDRLLACPGSRPLEARLPMDFSGDIDGDAMTWRGNWCHWHAAWRLVKEFGAHAPDGIAPPVVPLGWKPSPWDERAADWYVENVVVATPPDHILMVEHRVTHEFERFVLSGQLDVYSFNPTGTVFIIHDQKSGPNVVDHAENNWQLAGYAALLRLMMPRLTRGKARILQKAAHDEPITEVEIDDLPGVVKFMEEKINEALAHRLEFEVGYKQCRLCPCIEACPALSLEFDAMRIILNDEQFDRLKVTLDTKSLCELAARGRAIAGPITRLMAAVKTRLLENPEVVALADGTQVQVVDEFGDRQVRAPKVAFEIVKEKLGEDEAWETFSMSLTKLEDALAATGMKRKSTTEPSATSFINDRLAHLITRPKTKKLKFVS